MIKLLPKPSHLRDSKMALVENIPPENGDSEMEEGEIVDDLDDLSDISSEEEFLLRQRLQVLENYNNVLERTKAKRSFTVPGKHRKDHLLPDLSEISGTELDDTFPRDVIVYRPEIVSKPKTYHKHKRKETKLHSNLSEGKNKVAHSKTKSHRKKKPEVKVVSASSEESDDEYRNKRRKLANAVVVQKSKCNDKSSLQDRIQKMLLGDKIRKPVKNVVVVNKETETDDQLKVEDVSCSPIILSSNNASPVIPEENICQLQKDQEVQNTPECIVLSTDEESSPDALKEDDRLKPQDVVDSVVVDSCEETAKKINASDSDEDLELLRQHALKSKLAKTKAIESIPLPDKPQDNDKTLSEGEDSDTAELRMICLKSALLKKAIEMKQKQKLRKRLSQTSNLQDELLNEQFESMSKIESGNNTDIESMDMEIGSDGDERTKDIPIESAKIKSEKDDVKNVRAEDDLDEDEDLLRAKLLTSLSKNLPRLVDPTLINKIEHDKSPEKPAQPSKTQAKLPENRIVINLGESESEDEEHEATKNLTKMHMKLSEQVDFQEKLDLFLKSTRMEVEKSKLPDVVQEPPQTPQKFVAKAVKHLPKSEQIEYRNLVKRMAELEKIKQARQAADNQVNKAQVKDTLKPRNVTLDPTKLIAVNNLEEQVALSRKKIAEESTKMLKLKEEATKLSQKYKIVATELKNISTAITLNKKEQRAAQNRLSRIRLQHQRLLNSTSSRHSKGNGQLLSLNRPVNDKFVATNRLQKENDPSKEPKAPSIIQSVTVTVVNDLTVENTASNARLSGEVDTQNDKKTVTVPENSIQTDSLKESRVPIEHGEQNVSVPDVEQREGCRNSGKKEILYQRNERRKEFDDYESPLQSLGDATWEADPNAILCPFEIGGHCKDPDCNYLHPKAPSQ